MRRQKGLTLTGFIVAAVIVVLILLLGFKLGPAYSEYYSVQKLLRSLATEPLGGSGDFRGMVRRNFQLRSSIDNITAVNANDLQITKEGDQILIVAEYTVRVPLVYNLSACMDFRATSEK